MNTQPMSAVSPATRTTRVLVAEDSPVNRALAMKQLEVLGYPADAVADGLQALAAFKKDHHNIILMDCDMPEMNGYEATWQIRDAEDKETADGGTQPHTYIIAMTANSEADTRERCTEAGMDDFIDKPVQLAELEAALRRATADRAAQRDIDEIIDPLVIAGLRQLRMPNKPDPLIELVDLFLREAPSQIDTLEKAIPSKDPGALSSAISAASALKGGAVNLGARYLAALADEILQSSKSGYLSMSQPLVQKARTELERARVALETIKEQSRLESVKN